MNVTYSEKTKNTNLLVTFPGTTKNSASTRERADARRQRILEKSQCRIEMVSGNLKSKDTEPTSEEKSISWQKRRRYKKKYLVNNEVKEPIVNEAIEKSILNKNATNNGDDYGETFEVKYNSSISDKSTSPISVTWKKYQGVAKMRRKMIADRKASIKKKSEIFPNQYKSNNAISQSKFSLSAPSKFNRRFPLTPIVINLITVFCLFFVGLDVGLQNHPHKYRSTIQHEFIWNGGKFTSLPFFGNKATILTDFGAISEQKTLAEEDEFSTKPLPRCASYHDNKRKKSIDPLFRIDLNDISSGPGALNTASRIAIRLHRAITYLLFTIPRYILLLLLSLSSRLIKYPPILMTCSIIVRFIGRYIFHGIIPNIEDMVDVQVRKKIITSNGSVIEMTSTSGREMMNSNSEHFNLSLVAKKIVTTFMSTNFPTVVLAYTVFQDVKNDMFIILTGFLIGVVFPTEFLINRSISDEL